MGPIQLILYLTQRAFIKIVKISILDNVVKRIAIYDFDYNDSIKG